MSMKLDELTHGVPKGSQKPYKHPMATDDPEKYVGKWEAYDTPQGLRRVKKKKKVKESLTRPVPYQWVEQSEKGWYAKFQSGTEKFFVAIAPMVSNPKIWGIMWDTEWFGVKKSPQEVFATVLAVIKDFFAHKQPETILFKPNNDKLMKVYKAMARALEPTLRQMGYEVDYRKPTFGVIRKVVKEARLDELMDRPARYVWDEPRRDGTVETASFESNGVKYVAFFTFKNYMSYELSDAENFKSIRNKRKVWEMEFDRVGWEPYNSTRELLSKKPRGKALEVLSTVATIIGDFLRKKNPDQLYFSTTLEGLKVAYKGMGRILEPKLHSLGYELDWHEPLKGQLIGYIERRSAMLEDTDVSYVTRRAPTQNAIGAEELYPTDVVAQRKSKKAPLKTVRQSVKALGGKLPRLDEARLDELMDRPLSYEWQETYRNRAGQITMVPVLFYSNGIEYEVLFDMLGSKNDRWMMEFSHRGDGVDSGVYSPKRIEGQPRGKPMEVFATVVKIASEFINTYSPDNLTFATAHEGLKKVYMAMARMLQPELTKLGYRVSFSSNNDQLRGDITKIASDKLDETIRKPQFGILNTDYEVQDEAGNVIGVCEVHDNVIEKLMAKDVDEEFLGRILRNLLSVLVREADRIKAPLRMQLQPGSRDDLKRFLERFGFRHVGDNIMKRIEGSVTPPSVIMATGINGSQEA